MRQDVVSILDPAAAEAKAVTLGRQAFLREIAVAGLLALAAPLAGLVGIFLHARGAGLIGVAVGTVISIAILAVPVLFYASFRLNAATLARERAVIGAAAQVIHAPMKGPFLLRRSMVAGSTRSRILAGLPVCIGFGALFAGMAWVLAESHIMVLSVPLAAMLVAQVAVAINLLR